MCRFSRRRTHVVGVRADLDLTVRIRAQHLGDRVERHVRLREQPGRSAGERDAGDDAGREAAVGRGARSRSRAVPRHSPPGPGVAAAPGGAGGVRRCGAGAARRRSRMGRPPPGPGAASRRSRGAGRGPGAAVEAVEHAVAVLVAGAAERVHRGALRRLGAAVEAVGDGVAVAVLRAAVRIHQHARLACRGSDRVRRRCCRRRSPGSSQSQSTAAPATVVAQRSTPSGTPSASLSLGQPVPSTWRRRGVGAAVAVVEDAVAVGCRGSACCPSMKLSPRLTPKLGSETPSASCRCSCCGCRGPRRGSARSA